MFSGNDGVDGTDGFPGSDGEPGEPGSYPVVYPEPEKECQLCPSGGPGAPGPAGPSGPPVRYNFLKSVFATIILLLGRER